MGKDQTLEYVQKQKNIQQEITLQVQKLRQEVSMTSIFKLAILTSAGVMGRAALQWFPSVEPIVPLAIVVSFFLGYKYGLPSGMGAFYASNFLVWGGQGPWTIFQVIGTGVAALTGSAFGKVSKSKYSLIGAALIGTLFYEIIVDFSFIFLGFFSPVTIFLFPLPFTITHMISSLGFCLILYGFKDKISNILHEAYELRLHSFGNSIFGNSGFFGKQSEQSFHTISVWRWRRKDNSKNRLWK